MCYRWGNYSAAGTQPLLRGDPASQGNMVRGDFTQYLLVLVNPSTKSILLFVSLQDMLQLDGSQAGQLHTQTAVRILRGVRLE